MNVMDMIFKAVVSIVVATLGIIIRTYVVPYIKEKIEKIKKEASSLKAIRDELKFWDYNDVLKVFDSLSNAYESINSLGLVPSGLF